MLEQLKGNLRQVTHDAPGRRFVHLYERSRGQGSHGLAWLSLAGAIVCAAIGVVLSFLPGPAFVFFILAGALLAMHSRWVAVRLDRGELALRRAWQHWRAWRQRTRAERQRSSLH